MSFSQSTPGIVGPFDGIDVPWLLRMRSETRRDHPFLIWAPFDAPARTWRYGEFHQRVGALAAGLKARGVKPGEYLLIHLDKCVEAVMAWFACVELGAIAVTTNTRSAAAEMEYFADHCGAVAAITQPAYAELISAHCKNLRWLAVTSHDAGAAPAQGRKPRHADSFEALFADSADRPRRAADPLAPCSVQYTSGTTSRPKAVLWTHANALWGAKVNAAHEDLHQGDVHQTYLPLFHTNALAYSMLASLWVGATCVIQPRFSASRFWNVAAEHGCTWTSTIPFCMKALLEHEIPKQHRFRLWGTAVNDPPPFATFGVKIIGWWGMTETITHGIVGEIDQPNAPMSIGRAAAEYSIRITDGAPTPVGGTGDLLIKGIPGLSLFREYLHNEKATRESFDEHGYFITGDRVTLLENGFIKFGDRAKDMLKVGGENVAASEIEQVIAVVPGVREAAVVAKKHPMLDEVPVVFIIPVEGGRASADLHDNVMAACRNALADFKVPREIHFVDELPRSTLEKVAKAELRKLLG
jgi:crotonobetaine/carnitine-CoA ligase